MPSICHHDRALAVSLLTIGVLALMSASASAQFATPGIGVRWTMDDLVAQSGGVVTGTGPLYDVNGSITVTATDTLDIQPGEQLTFIDGTGAFDLVINGCLLAVGAPADSVVFTSDPPTPGSWAGLQFEDTAAGSGFQLSYCVVAFAHTAVDIYGADVLIEHSALRRNLDKALEFGNAAGEIRACVFRHNEQQTVTMTLGSSPLIEDCLFEDNNRENEHPYPYINIGLQGNNSPTLRGNQIYGSGHEMSGGIAVWNACAGLFEDNMIEGCGYGILCYQFDANPTIKDNVLVDNNIHPDTLNWGFGIACNGQNAPLIVGNTISGHGYGVALINGAQPNLGDLINDFPGDDGMNQFLGNGLDDTFYELYNNTSNDIMAQNNWWGTADAAEVEDRIVHQVDDPSLGFVNYLPYLETTAVGDEPPLATAAVLITARAYPNPFNPRVIVAFTLQRDAIVTVRIHDAGGRLVRELGGGNFAVGDHTLVWNGADHAGRAAASGTYFYRIVAGAEAVTGKMVLVR